MLYFNPKPNFKRLNKYYTFPHSVEQMKIYHADGYAIVLNHVYTDEAVAELETGFTALVAKYSLSAYRDDLLFLVLGKIDEHEAILDELYFQYDQRKRTKELAQLLLTVVETPPNQYDSLVLKTLLKTTKLTDKTTLQWIGSSLIDSIQSGNMLAKDFEYRIMTDFFETTENGKVLSPAKLAIEAERKIETPTKGEKASYADICLYLRPYLINETDIRPDPERLFSDAMLNFYFDLLVLFGYLDPNKIMSEPKDYMRTLLNNRIRVLNSDYQGNKNI